MAGHTQKHKFLDKILDIVRNAHANGELQIKTITTGFLINTGQAGKRPYVSWNVDDSGRFSYPDMLFVDGRHVTIFPVIINELEQISGEYVVMHKLKDGL